MSGAEVFFYSLLVGGFYVLLGVLVWRVTRND